MLTGKRLFVFIALVYFSSSAYSQVFSPIAVTGFNQDVIAEPPGTDATLNTTNSMDLSNHIMYSAGFSVNANLNNNGVIVNSGTIVSGTKTWQLEPFTANNTLFLGSAAVGTLTLAVPDSFSKLSLLAFSTEGAGSINVTLNFTNATSTNFGPFTLPDWFGGAGAVYSGFGRCDRLSAPPFTISGFSTDPRFYSADMTLSCADKQKQLQSITITHASGTNGFIMAVAGVPYSFDTLRTITSATCGGNNGSVTLNVIGSGGPYTYSWNTVPVQNGATASNLSPANYICTITDAQLCPHPATITIPNGGGSINVTPSATNDTICNGTSTILSASGAAAYTWSPAAGLSSTNGTPITANPNVTTTYYVTGTSGACVDNDSIVITVIQIPTITISATNDSVCIGSSVTLTAAGSGNYTWSPSTGLSATTGASVVATPTVSTTYFVTEGASGCLGDTSILITAIAIPVVHVTPSADTICNGTSTTLTATGSSAYSWSPAIGLSGTVGATVTASPTISTTYTVTETTSGCSGDTTVPIIVIQVPTISVTPPSASICAGFSTTLTASGSTTYNWSPATGLNTTSGSVVTASPSTTTTYTVTETVSGCAGDTTVTVTVSAIPVVVINPSAPSICIGSSVALNASGAASYNWSPVSGLSATTGSSVTASPNVTTTYTVQETSSGCNADTTVVVTVNSIPTTLVSPGSLTMCSSDSALLIANGANTYSWSPALGLSSTTGASVVAHPPVTTTYLVTGTTNGCSSIDSSVITVIPVPNISVNPVIANICIGQSATLTASGASNYSWSPFTSLNTNSSASVIATPSASITYTVTGWTGSCTSQTTVGVVVNPLPSVSFTAIPDAVCPGKTSVLHYNGNSIGSAFVWTPSMVLDNANKPSPTATLFSPQNFVVTVTSPQGCSSTGNVYVDVFSLPKVSAGPDTIICGAHPLTIKASGGNQYNWTEAYLLPCFNCSEMTISPTKNERLHVTITDEHGCVQSDSIIISLKDECEWIDIPNAFTPNNDGVDDELHVLGDVRSIVFLIYDRWGQQVFKSTDLKKGWDGTYHGTNLPIGTYVYTIQAETYTGAKFFRKGDVTLLR